MTNDDNVNAMSLVETLKITIASICDPQTFSFISIHLSSDPVLVEVSRVVNRAIVLELLQGKVGLKTQTLIKNGIQTLKCELEP